MKTSKPCFQSILFIFSVFFLLPALSSAQDQFKLSDYKNPEYKWQQLNLNFGMAGNNLFNKQEVDSGYNEKTITSMFSNDLSADYYRTRNSLHYQGYQDVRLISAIGSTTNDYHDLNNANLDNTQKQRNGSVGLSFSTVNRFYNEKKMFIETDLDFSGHYDNGKIMNSAEQEPEYFIYKDIDYNYRFYTELPILAGIGRIEEVQDARLAVYILDDLKASGDIKRAATSDETLSLAGFITNLKNQRYFDTRLEKISQVTAIDSFLTVKGLKSQSNASYYTLINDNWDYADGPVRSTGGRFSCGVAPSIGLNFASSETFQRDSLDNGEMLYTSFGGESNIKEWAVAFIAGYIYERSTSLYWQHSFGANTAYSLYNQYYNSKYFNDSVDYYNSTTRTDSPKLRLDVKYKLGYYPNSRTNINLIVQSNYYQVWGDAIQDNNDDTKTDLDRQQVNCGAELSCYYYISPQLRLTIGGGSVYTYTWISKANPSDTFGDRLDHYLRNYITAGLVYKVF
jgi:hypothetical protein